MTGDARLYGLACGAALIAGPAMIGFASLMIFAAALLLLGGAWAGFSILGRDDRGFAPGRA